jgi:hypothetical protein
MKVSGEEQQKYDKFVSLNYYMSGQYDKKETFRELNKKIKDILKETQKEKSNGDLADDCNRIFYLALPPSVYTSVTQLLNENCRAKRFLSRSYQALRETIYFFCFFINKPIFYSFGYRKTVRKRLGKLKQTNKSHFETI